MGIGESDSTIKQRALTRNVRVHFTDSFNERNTPLLRRISETCEKIPYLPLPPKALDMHGRVTGINIAVSSNNGNGSKYVIYYEFDSRTNPDSTVQLEASQRSLDSRMRRYSI